MVGGCLSVLGGHYSSASIFQIFKLYLLCYYAAFSVFAMPCLLLYQIFILPLTLSVILFNIFQKYSRLFLKAKSF